MAQGVEVAREAALAMSLPALRLGRNQTTHNALHHLYFVGHIDRTTLWDLHQDVVRARSEALKANILTANGDTPSPLPPEDELVACSENTIGHRIFQNILLPIQQCLQDLGFLFGDAKLRPPQGTGSNTFLLPDAVGYVESDGPAAQADGEIKHCWNTAHSYQKALRCVSDVPLRRILGQPVKNMLQRGHSWCWWSSYEETALFRLRGDTLEISPVIPFHQASSADKASVREILAWAYRQNAGVDKNTPSSLSVEKAISPRPPRPDKPPMHTPSTGTPTHLPSTDEASATKHVPQKRPRTGE